MIEAAWRKPGVGRESVLILGGSLLIALAAQFRVWLPFSPVPVTGQTFAVLLLAATYGSKRGVATVLTYLSFGLLGFPVFAGPDAGIMWLLGPTAGYLIGFLGAAYLVGKLGERGWDRRPWSTAASMILGNVVIYTAGAAWLSGFIGWKAALTAGVLAFLPGDGLKIAFAMLLLPAGWKLIGRPAKRRRQQEREP